MFYTEIDDYNSGDNSQNVSVKLYKSEWSYLFNSTNIDELRDAAIKGDLRTSRFRSICWGLLLEILPSDSSKWLMVVDNFRAIYDLIKAKHYNDPHTEDSGPDNPLSQDDNSVWKQYFEDIELKSIIRQDVVRTSPGVEFFRTEKLQEIMINILFCYSREHPELCYRQGMHEILAQLLFVIHCDHQALLHVLEQSSSDVSDLIQQILNPAYLEADAYSMFNIIMEIMKDYYNVNDYFLSLSEQSEGVKITSSSSESEVVRKLSKIRDKMLTKHDPELYGHLLDLDISFTTFGVRWLRLLFGGEFSLMDSLVLWDTIFAKSPRDFELVNHIFVAMLVLLRVQLLKSDNINCLNYLMRYPHVDVMTVIEYALHIFDPKTYIFPSFINSLKHDKSNNLKANIINDQPERPSTFISNYSTRRTHTSSDDLLELCRIKILQYHSVLDHVVPIHHKEGRQALSGMLELCGLLNPRSGIIEMGKDVARCTTPIQTPETPEGGPLLPPPASAITMKVFRKTESSTDSRIQGAPTKNPLKQMKRFHQGDSGGGTVGLSAAAVKVPRVTHVVHGFKFGDSKNADGPDKIAIASATGVVKTAADGGNTVTEDERANSQCSIDVHNDSVKKFVKLSDLQHHRRRAIMCAANGRRAHVEQRKQARDAERSADAHHHHHHHRVPTAWSFQPGHPTGMYLNANVAGGRDERMAAGPKNASSYPRPTCAYPCLIGMALRSSPTGAMPLNEIYKFVSRNFPYFKTDAEEWKRCVHQCLWTSEFFETVDAKPVAKGWYKLRLPLHQVGWRVDPSRADQLDRDIRSWALFGPGANRSSMFNPEYLLTLVRSVQRSSHVRSRRFISDHGRCRVGGEHVVKNSTVTSDGNRDLTDFAPNEERIVVDDEIVVIEDSDDDIIVIDDEDDNPFAMVTLTPEEVANMLSDDDQSTTTYDGLDGAACGKKKQTPSKRPGPKYKKRPLNAFMLFSKMNRRKIRERYPAVFNMDVSKILGKTWKSMSLKERMPFMRESDRLKELYKTQKTHTFPPKKSLPKI